MRMNYLPLVYNSGLRNLATSRSTTAWFRALYTASHKSFRRAERWSRVSSIHTTSTARMAEEEGGNQEDTKNLTPEQRLERLSGTLNEAFAVDIQRFQGKGRGLIASENFAEGDQVIQEFPLGHIVDPEVSRDYCNSCFNKLPNKAPPSKGMQIGSVTYEGFKDRYCSEECYKAGKRDGHEMMWGMADDLAEYCQNHQSRHPLVALQMVCRSMVGDFELFWSQVEHLASVQPSEWTEGAIEEFKEQHSLIRNALTVRLGGGKKEIDDIFEHVLNFEWYLTLRGLLRLNSFTIPKDAIYSDPPEFLGSYIKRNANPEQDAYSPVPSHDSHGLGTAVFLGTSFINHHCEPNLDVSFSLGPTIRLHANRDIIKGEELTIPYVDLNLPVTDRKTKLVTGYGFICNGCQDCKDFDHSQLFEGNTIPDEVKHQLK
eukprot:gb/GECG01016335.1/.p1 GENE.gb/GECG01016335.1/~~gb/GECG01016335.1/.p1  ORF type:complete len:429 (+),score=43.47 gb/GECG01016335.1/:1-1287(+)